MARSLTIINYKTGLSHAQRHSDCTCQLSSKATRCLVNTLFFLRRFAAALNCLVVMCFRLSDVRLLVIPKATTTPSISSPYQNKRILRGAVSHRMREKKIDTKARGIVAQLLKRKCRIPKCRLYQKRRYVTVLSMGSPI